VEGVLGRLTLGRCLRPALALQGWATIEEFERQDWKDVELTLVSARPRTRFHQALSRPIRARARRSRSERWPGRLIAATSIAAAVPNTLNKAAGQPVPAPAQRNRFQERGVAEVGQRPAAPPPMAWRGDEQIRRRTDCRRPGRCSSFHGG